MAERCPIATTAPIQEGPLVVLPMVGLLTYRLVRSKPSHPRSRAMALRIKKERTSATLADRMRMTAAGPSRNRTGVPCSMTLRQGPSTTSTGKLLAPIGPVKRPAIEFRIRALRFDTPGPPEERAQTLSPSKRNRLDATRRRFGYSGMPKTENFGHPATPDRGVSDPCEQNTGGRSWRLS